jgi:hypothetical protein
VGQISLVFASHTYLYLPIANELHIRAASVWTKQSDCILLGFAIHPRGSRRHSGNGDADSNWPFLEQPPDGDCRNMAFDNIATDFCGMARSQIGGYG